MGNARADQSSFRLTGAERTAQGARLMLQYQNNWGTQQRDLTERSVRLFLHTKHFELNTAHAEVEAHGLPLGMRDLGVVDMFGSGNCAVDLDYAQLGCQSGQQIWLHGRWQASGHGWGMPWPGRDSGTLVLP